MSNILYSFRRCPYAIRARLALAYSQQKVLLREIILENKPQELLNISTKGTVPVLYLSNGNVIDESLEIMVWALEQADPDGWLAPSLSSMLDLIDENDFEFKTWLDKYKYADRYPEYSKHDYCLRADDFLLKLNRRLQQTKYLFSHQLSLADIAIFPFIRQFSSVDKAYFEQLPYTQLKDWLTDLTAQPFFQSSMQKYPTWLESAKEFTTFNCTLSKIEK